MAGYCFRTNSIHAEVELIAREFDNALPPKKSDSADRLIWFIDSYPNAQVQRALPIVEKNFLDKSNENSVRKKCAIILGRIGANYKGQEATSQLLGLLLTGMGESGNPQMVHECMGSIGEMAEARKWQDFDSVISPLLERVADAKHPNGNPNIVHMALDVLEEIKPNDPACLIYAEDVKKELIEEKQYAGGRRLGGPYPAP